MGTEISEEDMINIRSLSIQVIEINEYREQLFDYLKNRMQAIAPNLSIMVGELVGARLIAHAGSLMSLAKYPASTVQILGAEKALFRALKTKHQTPKYGLIYHASLVGQATPKNKGKISRMVAAKTALATRFDALAENVDTDIGVASRSKIEARLRVLEGTHASTPKTPKKIEKYDSTRSIETGVKRTATVYNAAVDSTLAVEVKKEEPKKKKRKKEKVETPKKEDTPKKKEEEASNGEVTPAKEEKKKKTKEEKKVTNEREVKWKK